MVAFITCPSNTNAKHYGSIIRRGNYIISTLRHQSQHYNLFPYAEIFWDFKSRMKWLDGMNSHLDGGATRPPLYPWLGLPLPHPKPYPTIIKTQPLHPSKQSHGRDAMKTILIGWGIDL